MTVEYLLLIHNNHDPISDEQWQSFFECAQASGLFLGGSAIDKPIGFGKPSVSSIHLGGFMRFEASDLSQLKSLLEKHPVLFNGGSLELFEMPKS